MNRLFSSSRALWSFLWGLLWVFLLHPLFRFRTQNSVWVIGGHRGRHYGDNSAAVEAEARRQGKMIVWIANPRLAQQLRAKGISAIDRHSWKARRAISTAGLLVYSHGEDDLDLLLILLRGRTAPRVYLDHCMCTLKAGGMTDPTLLSAAWPIRSVRKWLLTRWDYALCASEEVRQNFHQCYPMNPLSPEHARLGGGAHLDAWKKGLESVEKRQIYWFPTFRETPQGRSQLHKVIETVTRDLRLRDWLERNSYRFLIGTHVNAKDAPLRLSEPFSLSPLSSLTEDARQSELLISDYSGIVYDFLLLERPQILFAFDLSEYTKRRHLFGKYEDRDFALHPRTPEQLVQMLISEAWREPQLRKRASEHRLRSLPPQAESYARLSVLELCKIDALTAQTPVG